MSRPMGRDGGCNPFLSQSTGRPRCVGGIIEFCGELLQFNLQKDTVGQFQLIVRKRSISACSSGRSSFGSAVDVPGVVTPRSFHSFPAPPRNFSLAWAASVSGSSRARWDGGDDIRAWHPRRKGQVGAGCQAVRA